jgi:hypothetical protein
MKSHLTVIASLLCLSALPVLASEGDDARFQKGEWEISPFLTYVDQVGDDWGAGATGMYFISDKFGVGGTTYWTDFNGTFIDNLAAEGQFRLPILKSLAPYAVASIGYEFETKEFFETFGGGINFRPFKKIAAFSDIQYRIANETQNGVFIRLGVRFNF